MPQVNGPATSQVRSNHSDVIPNSVSIPSRAVSGPHLNGGINIDPVSQRRGSSAVAANYIPVVLSATGSVIAPSVAMPPPSSGSVISLSLALPSPSDSSSTSPEDNRGELVVYTDPAVMHSYSASSDKDAVRRDGFYSRSMALSPLPPSFASVPPFDAPRSARQSEAEYLEKRRARVAHLVKRFSAKMLSDRETYCEKLRHYLLLKDRLNSIEDARRVVLHHEEALRLASQTAGGEFSIMDSSWIEAQLPREQVDLIKAAIESESPSGFVHSTLSMTKDFSFTSTKSITSSQLCPFKSENEFDATDWTWGNVIPPDAPPTAKMKRPSSPKKCGDKNKSKPKDQTADKAKKEAELLQRVAELKRAGLWGEKRLPRVLEPPRPKTHWDFVLEEMAWMATDFAQERKWKKGMAKKVCRTIQKQFQDQDQQADRKKREEEQKLRKIASFCAREIRNFWSNVEKLVEFKTNTMVDAKRRKALDQHLNFVVEQTEKFSTMLAEGMNKPEASGDSKQSNSHGSVSEEVLALQRESQMDDEELLNSLPPGYIEAKLREIPRVDVYSGDEEFKPDSAESDEEATIEEQERHESSLDREKELTALKAEADIPIEELLKMHQKAVAQIKYESDEDMASDGEQEEIAALKELMEEDFDVGSTSNSGKTSRTGSPGKELTDVAEMAATFQPKGYTLSTAQVRTAVPFLLKHELREYQHIGLDWLVTLYEKKLNGILADEMGLGKTIQTIALLAHLACEKENWGPHLIVVPTSVMLNWEMEFKKWLPGFKLLTYYGSQKERKLKRVGWTKQNVFHVCITSYQLILQDHAIFRRKKWKYLILDEAQNIKNFKSQRWQLLLNFQSQRRLLLTGTPLQNNLMELWSLMHFLMPNVFQSHKDFKEWFSNPMTGMIEGSQEYNENVIRRLHKVLRPFLLRRLKSEVEKQLPKKFEHVVMCKLSKRQRYLYEDYMSRSKTKDTLDNGNLLSVINVLMQLRKVCNHPNLFEERPVISPFVAEPVMIHVPGMVAHLRDNSAHERPDLLNCPTFNLLANRTYSARAVRRIQELKTKMPVSIEDFVKDRESKYRDPPPLPKGQVRMNFRSFNPLYRRIKPINVFTVKRRWDILSHESRLNLAKTKATGGMLEVPIGKEKSFGLGDMAVLRRKLKAKQREALKAAQTGWALSEGVKTLTPKPGKTAPMGSSTSPTAVRRPFPPAATYSSLSTPARPAVCDGLVLATPESVGALTSKKQPIVISSDRVVTPGARSILTVDPGKKPGVGGSVSATIPSVAPLVLDASGKPAVQGIVTSITPRAKTGQVLQRVMATQQLSRPGPSGLNRTPGGILKMGDKGEAQKSAPARQIRFEGSTKKPKPKLKRRKSKPLALPELEDSSREMKRKMRFYPKSHLDRLEAQHSEWARALVRADRLRFTQPVLYSWDTMAACLTTDNLTRRDQTLRWFTGQDVMWEDFAEFGGRRGTDKILTRWKWRKRRDAEGVSSFCGGLELCYLAMAEADAWDSLGYSPPIRLGRICKSPLIRLRESLDVVGMFSIYVPGVATFGTEMMTVTRPNYSVVTARDVLVEKLLPSVLPRVKNVHPLVAPHANYFPELRLIEYDCGKLQVLSRLLRDLKSKDHRVLIFTQMSRVLDVLEAFLSFHGYRYLRLDGATRVDQRQVLMERFNMDPRIFCFILSTRSGGVGVNLTGADTVIFYDSDWNPTMDAQAQDRCHRIGQTRDVHIYRLISERTVEENILRKANQKRLLGDLAIEGGNFTTAHFKKSTIHDLFEVREESSEFRLRDDEIVETVEEVHAPAPSGTSSRAISPNLVTKENVFESALNAAEEDEDAKAAKVARAEACEELAEFEEGAVDTSVEPVSKQEVELKQILSQLTPVEAYAVAVVERELEPWTTEKIATADAEIEEQKKEWEKNHLKAMHEAEARESSGDDEVVEEPVPEVEVEVDYEEQQRSAKRKAPTSTQRSRKRARRDSGVMTYSGSEARNKMWCTWEGDPMPIWAPPTPPADDNDVYVDRTFDFLYETVAIPDECLPPLGRSPTPATEPTAAAAAQLVVVKDEAVDVTTTTTSTSKMAAAATMTTSKEEPTLTAAACNSVSSSSSVVSVASPALLRPSPSPSPSVVDMESPDVKSVFPLTPYSSSVSLGTPIPASANPNSPPGLPSLLESPVSRRVSWPKTPQPDTPEPVVALRLTSSSSGHAILERALASSSRSPHSPVLSLPSDKEFMECMSGPSPSNLMTKFPVKKRGEDDGCVSLFDRPTPALVKMRRDALNQRGRGILSSSFGSGLGGGGGGGMASTGTQSTKLSPTSQKSGAEQDQSSNWTIYEDWIMLTCVQNVQALPTNMGTVFPAQLPNFDLMANMLNLNSTTKRSEPQVRARYENVIVAREEGKITYDLAVPKKPASKKMKGVLKVNQPIKVSRPVKTAQLVNQDNNHSMTNLFMTRLTALKMAANKKRKTAPRRVLQGDAKLMLVGNDDTFCSGAAAMAVANEADRFSLSGVVNSLNPKQVAVKRAQHIAKEKQKTQEKARLQQQEHQQRQLQLQQKRMAAVAASGLQREMVLGAAHGSPPIIHIAAGKGPALAAQQFVASGGQKIFSHPMAGQSILQHQLSAASASGTLTPLSPVAASNIRMTRKPSQSPTITLQEFSVQARGDTRSSGAQVPEMAQTGTGTVLTPTTIRGFPGAKLQTTTVPVSRGPQMLHGAGRYTALPIQTYVKHQAQGLPVSQAGTQVHQGHMRKVAGSSSPGSAGQVSTVIVAGTPPGGMAGPSASQPTIIAATPGGSRMTIAVSAAGLGAASGQFGKGQGAPGQKQIARPLTENEMYLLLKRQPFPSAGQAGQVGAIAVSRQSTSVMAGATLVTSVSTSSAQISGSPSGLQTQTAVGPQTISGGQIVATPAGFTLKATVPPVRPKGTIAVSQTSAALTQPQVRHVAIPQHILTQTVKGRGRGMPASGAKGPGLPTQQITAALQIMHQQQPGVGTIKTLPATITVQQLQQAFKGGQQASFQLASGAGGHSILGVSLVPQPGTSNPGQVRQGTAMGAGGTATLVMSGGGKAGTSEATLGPGVTRVIPASAASQIKQIQVVSAANLAIAGAPRTLDAAGRSIVTLPPEMAHQIKFSSSGAAVGQMTGLAPGTVVSHSKGTGVATSIATVSSASQQPQTISLTVGQLRQVRAGAAAARGAISVSTGTQSGVQSAPKGYLITSSGGQAVIPIVSHSHPQQQHGVGGGTQTVIHTLNPSLVAGTSKNVMSGLQVLETQPVSIPIVVSGSAGVSGLQGTVTGQQHIVVSSAAVQGQQTLNLPVSKPGPRLPNTTEDEMDQQVQQNVRQIMQQYKKQQYQKQLEQKKQQGVQMHPSQLQKIQGQEQVQQIQIQPQASTSQIHNFQIQYQPQVGKYIAVNRAGMVRIPTKAVAVGTASPSGGQLIATAVATTIAPSSSTGTSVTTVTTSCSTVPSTSAK